MYYVEDDDSAFIYNDSANPVICEGWISTLMWTILPSVHNFTARRGLGHKKGLTHHYFIDVSVPSQDKGPGWLNELGRWI